MLQILNQSINWSIEILNQSIGGKSINWSREILNQSIGGKRRCIVIVLTDIKLLRLEPEGK